MLFSDFKIKPDLRGCEPGSNIIVSPFQINILLDFHESWLFTDKYYEEKESSQKIQTVNNRKEDFCSWIFMILLPLVTQDMNNFKNPKNSKNKEKFCVKNLRKKLIGTLGLITNHLIFQVWGRRVILSTRVLIVPCRHSDSSSFNFCQH